MVAVRSWTSMKRVFLERRRAGSQDWREGRWMSSRDTLTGVCPSSNRGRRRESGEPERMETGMVEIRQLWKECRV